MQQKQIEIPEEKIQEFKENLNKSIIQYAYLKEILMQTEGITENIADLNSHLSSTTALENQNLRESYIYKFFRIIQNIQTHAGMVSKLICPDSSRNKHSNFLKEYRSEMLINLLDLKTVLDVKTNEEVKEILLSIRELRNHLEHFDERFDRWVFEENPLEGRLIDLNLGNIRDLEKYMNGIKYNLLRFYDIETTEFYIRDQKFNQVCYNIQQKLIPLQKIRDKVKSILPNYEKELKDSKLSFISPRKG